MGTKKIRKFKIKSGAFGIDLPLDYKVIHVTRGYMWIEGSFPVVDGIQRVFRAIGTGEAVSVNAEHVGTYFGGPFVWHLYSMGDW